MTTSDIRGAGTDADVTVVLYGSQGDSGEQRLESSANDFERGKVGPLQTCISWSSSASLLLHRVPCYCKIRSKVSFVIVSVIGSIIDVFLVHIYDSRCSGTTNNFSKLFESSGGWVQERKAGESATDSILLNVLQ